MASNREYEILLDKYNVVVAKAQDLQEQLLTKQKQWVKRDNNFSTIEKVTRELCENILAKDSNETVLGADYSWSSIPIMELLNKSKNALRKYMLSQKSFMQKLADVCEYRRQEIESLQEQIAVMKTQPGALKISQEDLKQQIEKEKKEQEILASMPMKAKQAVEDGKAEIVMDSFDNVDLGEEELYKGIAEVDAKIQITPKSIPVVPNRKQLENKKSRKANAMMAHTVNLKEYEAKLDEVGWKILETIGKEGVSIYMDIETSLIQKEPMITTSKCRSCIGILTSIGLTRKEPVQNPLKGRLYVYQLTDMGSRLFQDRFGTVPVISEMDKIMAEHDNCVHGYGIKFISDMLRESGAYTEVSDMNRKKPIDVGNGIKYIPDIICSDENGHKMYIEYECVNHTQTNFNSKCNKMTKITDVLNFIVPNQNDVNKIKEEIKKWIENRGAKSLGHVTIRVTGAYQLKDTNLTDNRNWKLVFIPGKRLEPYENF